MNAEFARQRISIKLDAARIPPHKQLTSVVRSWHQAHLSKLIQQPLDRIAELGDERTYGHTGCVNAISWAQNGQLLLTGSDDTNVCMWRLDPSNIDDDFALVNTAIIETGHDANIFAAHMLPCSTKIVTCSLDSQVRVSDIGHGHVSGRERGFRHSTSVANVAVYRCHGSASKRVLLEDSPDTFLKVAEDGRVRQHDLRVPPHRCRAPTSMMYRARRKPDLDDCPPPLLRLPHELHSISSSPLVPHQFVVAGDSPYGYLFDRRHSGRLLQQEWGVPVESQSMTTCVRRFGRTGQHSGHITGARMARSNSHEVVLSYSGDGVHLFSLLDDMTDSVSSRSKASSIVSTNRSPKASTLATDLRPLKRKAHSVTVTSDKGHTYSQAESAPMVGHRPPSSTLDKTQDSLGHAAHSADDYVVASQSESVFEDRIEPEAHWDNAQMEPDSDSSSGEHADVPSLVSIDGSSDEEDEDEYIYMDEEGEDFEDELSPQPNVYSGVPLIHPRTRYAGAANTKTIKDVNFVGPGDELVASGSDDGNFFLWDKSTSKIHGIYEGDGSVVNVIEAHPFLPILAVSGIDSTVKIFGPSRTGERRFNKTELADIITTSNEERARRPVGVLTRTQLMQMLALHRVGGSAIGGIADDEDGSLGCATQ